MRSSRVTCTWSLNRLKINDSSNWDVSDLIICCRIAHVVSSRHCEMQDLYSKPTLAISIQKVQNLVTIAETARFEFLSVLKGCCVAPASPFVFSKLSEKFNLVASSSQHFLPSLDNGEGLETRTQSFRNCSSVLRCVVDHRHELLCRR